MKITNTTLAILCSTIVLILGMVVTLIIAGKDGSQLLQWVGSTLIPLIPIMFAVQKADKAQKNSEQAVHNTNGRMSELVGLLYANNIAIPDAYKDVQPTVPASMIPDEYHGMEPDRA